MLSSTLFCTPAMATVPAMLLIIENFGKHHKKRFDCQYQEGEKEVLYAFKEEYRAQINQHGRAQIFCSKILPAMFNYWYENQDYAKTEQDCSDHIRVFVISASGVPGVLN